MSHAVLANRCLVGDKGGMYLWAVCRVHMRDRHVGRNVEERQESNLPYWGLGDLLLWPSPQHGSLVDVMRVVPPMYVNLHDALIIIFSVHTSAPYT